MPDHIRFLSMDFFIALMITFFVLSVLSQILIGILYQHMLEEAENMQTTQNRILQQFKQKFAGSYASNNGVTNVPVFVEKFLNRLQIGRFSLNMIRGLSGQFMFLSVLSAGIGICRALAGGASFFSLIPYYAVTLVGLYFYFSVLSIVDIPGRRSMLKTNLIDFVENDMLVKLADGTGEFLQEAHQDRLKKNADVRSGRREKRRESKTGVFRETEDVQMERLKETDGAQKERLKGLEEFQAERLKGAGEMQNRQIEESMDEKTSIDERISMDKRISMDEMDSVEEDMEPGSGFERQAAAERKSARWDTDDDFDKKRMPVLNRMQRENPNKPEGLDWTGGMMDETEKKKPYFDKEKEEELAELLKDLLS